MALTKMRRHGGMRQNGHPPTRYATPADKGKRACALQVDCLLHSLRECPCFRR